MDDPTNDLSEQITRLAEEYDPLREAEANEVRAFLQGLIVGSVVDQNYLHLESVDQGRDEYGAYLPYFTVTTKGGHRLRVSVEVDD